MRALAQAYAYGESGGHSFVHGTESLAHSGVRLGPAPKQKPHDAHVEEWRKSLKSTKV
jgi:hypothetical protein